MDEPIGNQQEVCEVTELAWLAGMLNGDGCFSITFRLRKETLKCDLSLTLTQCDPCLIERASALLLKMGINPGIAEYAPSGAGMRTKYNLRVTRMAHIHQVLDAIIPYLIGEKRAQAVLMQRYVKRRLPFATATLRNGNRVEDDHEAIAIAREFYAVRRQALPSDVAKVLNDYPAREYTQARGSARHSQE
jgi:hypothetical protein